MSGTLHGLGVGLGDPEPLTVKTVSALNRCSVVFTPAARIKDQSVALQITGPFIRKETRVEELVFPVNPVFESRKRLLTSVLVSKEER